MKKTACKTRNSRLVGNLRKWWWTGPLRRDASSPSSVSCKPFSHFKSSIRDTRSLVTSWNSRKEKNRSLVALTDNPWTTAAVREVDAPPERKRLAAGAPVPPTFSSSDGYCAFCCAELITKRPIERLSFDWRTHFREMALTLNEFFSHDIRR